MIRPSRIVEEVYELVEHPPLVKMLGGSFETRVKELARCVILENTKYHGLAVFRSELPKQFRALYFDVEEDTPFVWSAFTYMFKEMKATKLTFYTYDKDAGQRYRAVLLGATWVPNDNRWWWEAVPAEFATALEGRDDRRAASPKRGVGRDRERVDDFAPTAA